MTDLTKLTHLPWYRVNGREWRADTLYGQCKILGGTFALWYRRGFSTVIPGYTIYFCNKRVGWTVDAQSAIQTAEGTASGEMLSLLQGRFK